MDNPATWVAIIRTDGLALGLVIFGMVVTVWVVRWLLTHVVEPGTTKALLVADAHIDFLNQNTEATRAITNSVGQISAGVSMSGEKIDDIHNLLIVNRQGLTQAIVSQKESSGVHNG